MVQDWENYLLKWRSIYVEEIKRSYYERRRGENETDNFFLLERSFDI